MVSRLHTLATPEPLRLAVQFVHAPDVFLCHTVAADVFFTTKLRNARRTDVPYEIHVTSILPSMLHPLNTLTFLLL